jgi:hypothetical protein
MAPVWASLDPGLTGLSPCHAHPVNCCFFWSVRTLVNAAERDAKKFVNYELSLRGSTPQQALSAKGCHAPITGGRRQISFGCRRANA